MPDRLSDLAPAELDAAITEWALVERIAELEAELAEARMVRGPVRGGPPAAWDAWIVALPDHVFAELLGDREEPHRLSARLEYSTAPQKDRETARAWNARQPAKGWR